ncbi:MAG TPA: hypothetical protein VM536_10320 [Chloroflexia bacterium]|nr:hypothetical protein [Chloroflexia bacterium]
MPSRLPSRYARPVAGGVAALFAVSTLFPIAAGLLTARDVPAWLGVLDVAVAALLFVAAVLAAAAAGTPIASPIIELCYRAYRGFAGLLLALLAVFLLAADAIRWDVLLAGLAWRAWLLIYVLPGLLTLWFRAAPAPDPIPAEPPARL